MACVPSCQEEVMDFCSYSDNELSFYQVDQNTLGKHAVPWPNVDDSHTKEMCVQEKITKNSTARSFQKAVILVIAVEKMKHYSKARLFTDDDLMDIMNAVFERVNFDSCERTYVADSVYHFSRAISYDIRDIDQKSFVLKEPTQLVALHLQGSRTSYAVRLRMYLYRPNMEDHAGKVPIALNIKGQKLYLSCVQKGDQPVLQLEEANIQGDLDKSKLGRFLFYKVEIGNHTRFESAAFPHWYICTSSRPDEPVGLTNRIGEVSIVDYEVGKKLPSA